MPSLNPPPESVLANFWPNLWRPWRALVFELPHGAVWITARNVITGKTVTVGGEKYGPTTIALRAMIRRVE